MDSASLLRLLVVALAMAGCGSSVPASTSWAWQNGRWHAGDASVEALTAASLLRESPPLTLRAPEDTRSGVVLDALITASDTGIGQYQLGLSEGEVLDVALPPPPAATWDFAVIHVGPSGMRLSAPGGAEHHVACDPCATHTDWSVDGIAEALSATSVDQVLVSVSPEVPWGAVMQAYGACGERRLRIAREQ